MEKERCDECGINTVDINFELNKLQVLIENRKLEELDRLKCLDRIFEIRLMLQEVSVDNVVRGNFG